MKPGLGTRDSGLGKSPGLVCAVLEITLNRYLGVEREALDSCAALEGRVIELHVAGPDWSLYLHPHKGGVRIADAPDAAKPDVRASAPPLALLHMFRRASEANGSLPPGLAIEGDAELLIAFNQLLARVGFDPEEWLGALLGPGAGHRAGEAARDLFGWGRRAASTLALDTAEYLREETGDLVHRADIEQWMDEVDALREAADRLEARLERLERRPLPNPPPQAGEGMGGGES